MLGSAHAAPVPVQRQPKKVTHGEGLDTAKSQNKFVGDAVDLWKQQPRMDLTKFATTMLQAINGELATYGIPAVRVAFDSGIGASGVFSSKSWLVTVNVARFTKKSGTTPLGGLSPTEVEEAVGTLYHEARHADQNVLIIRVLLGKKTSVDDIVATTKIDKAIVEQVRGTKYADTPSAAKVTHAERMFEVMYGKHNQLLAFLVEKSSAFAAMDALKQDDSDLTVAAPHIQTFATWHTTVLAPKVKAMTSAKNPSPFDAAVLGDLQGIDTALSALLTQWRKWSTPKATPDDAQFVRERAEDLVKSVFTAYNNLESEKDAFRVEASVKAAFRARPK